MGKGGWEWSMPVSHEEYVAAVNGKWQIHLTTTRYVPRNWFPENMKGIRVLGLASGGGQQMPILAAAGCDCTVFDYSDEQLKRERETADREGYQIKIIKGDMTQPLPFEKESFDLTINPGSNCYVREVRPIFRECWRILKKNPEQMKQLQDHDAGIQFSHTLEELIGGQLEAGFILTDLYEDYNAEGRLKEFNIPAFIATRAIK
jgi:SAM-dependent methyltransferase